MLIRAAVPDDIPQIMSLTQHSETAAHWSTREYDALFAPEAPERVALVAIAETQPDKLAGFVIARCAQNEWEIENVVVAPESRRQGVAESLLNELLRPARERGVTDVFLEVRESNLAALALYRKMGFNEKGRRRAYYQNPQEDALVLQLPL
jgi:[ribosomal protein S18]-alanine N-acetyltransferase